MGNVICAPLKWAVWASAVAPGASKKIGKTMSNHAEILLELPIDSMKDATWAPFCHWSVADRHVPLARSDADHDFIGNAQRFVTAGKHLPSGGFD
jgi:hypothetical protein